MWGGGRGEGRVTVERGTGEAGTQNQHRIRTSLPGSVVTAVVVFAVAAVVAFAVAIIDAAMKTINENA